MRIGNRRSFGVLICAGLAGWLIGDGLAAADRLVLVPATQSAGPVIPMDPTPTPSPVIPAIPTPVKAMVSETTLEQAKELAKEYFRQYPDQLASFPRKKSNRRIHTKVTRDEHPGCYTEDRGPCWFVAPPFLSESNTERQGVYIVKATGKLYPFPPVDAQFLVQGKPAVFPNNEGTPISADQAAAIANQYYGLRPETKRTVEYRGDCWFSTLNDSDQEASEKEGVYIHKWTGKPSPFYPIDPQFFQWEPSVGSDQGDWPRVSKEQARLIWCKYFGFKPSEINSASFEGKFPYGLWVKSKGDYWYIVPPKSKPRPMSIWAPRVMKAYGAYVNQRTGFCSKEMPDESTPKSKKGKKRG